ncbi:class A sortase [Candidatus Enterococcus clewellii]|uniref:Sortase n=1 Tax=Candidatus Enterococcus clewellii TaxID=1834193 RepID=A0A242K5H9_9ENTE|nr:class A sortase [Enterococcus sp. 9E7_DIV0242]OTP14404.1 sortase [Enterococcus sp. 9E7_DIV0242]
MSSRKNTRSKPQKKRRKTNWFINILLFLLLVVGLALIFNTQIRNWLIQMNGRSYNVESFTKDDVAQNLNADTTFDFDSVESISTEAVLRAQFENKDLPVVGAIAIPSVEINLPVFKGLSNVALLTGAGTMKEDQVLGERNYALASHRTLDGVSLFSPLEYVEIGKLIYVTDLTNIYTYKITYKEKVDPSRVELIEDVEGKKMITLITCGDIQAITRIAVQGELDSITPINEANDDMLNAFQMEQRTA